MKKNNNIDIRRNYILTLKCLEELIEVARLNEDKESEIMFKRAILLIRTGVLKSENRSVKKNNS